MHLYQHIKQEGCMAINIQIFHLLLESNPAQFHGPNLDFQG